MNPLTERARKAVIEREQRAARLSGVCCGQCSEPPSVAEKNAYQDGIVFGIVAGIAISIFGIAVFVALMSYIK